MPIQGNIVTLDDGQQFTTGYVDDPGERRVMTRYCDQYGSDEISERLKAAAKEQYAKGRRQGFAWRAARKYDPTIFSDENQAGPDCTSHGVRNALQHAASIEIFTGQVGSIPKRFATEAFYGVRGHRGEGSNLSMLMNWARTKGGVLLRQNYPEAGVDLSKYNYWIGEKWGGRGVPAKLVEIAAQHQIRNVFRPKDVDTVVAALLMGWPFVHGGQMGFMRKRDKNGIAARNPDPREQWNHCMYTGDVDLSHTRANTDLFLCMNSWGPAWISGGVYPEDQPEGSFWYERKHIEEMFRSRSWDLLIISDFVDFAPRELPDWGVNFL